MWNDLSMSEKNSLIQLYIKNGVTSLDKMKEHYNSYQDGGRVDNNPDKDPVLKDRKPKANFYQRLLNPFRQTISNWENRINGRNDVATHKLSWATDDDGNAIVYPDVQEINGKLYDFTDPRNKESRRAALDRAIQTGDTIMMTPEQANFWTQHYKEFYPSFDYATGGHLYQEGGPEEPLVNKDYKKSATRMGRLQSYINDWNNFNYEEPSTVEELRTANGGLAQATYLLPKEQQDSLFKKAGYILNAGDYGLVRKAVGNRNIPVYQTVEDDILRNNLLHIGNRIGEEGNGTYFHHPLIHAGSFPTAYYVNPKTGEPYAKAWDLNDYGNTSSNKDKNLSLRLQNAGSKVLDMIGSPVVVTTGYQKLPDIPEELAEMMYKKHNLVPTENVFYDNELGSNYPLWSLPEVNIEVEKYK